MRILNSHDLMQSMENSDEELLKWAKSMKSWQRVLVDSARFAAWHNVSRGLLPLLLTLQLLAPLPCPVAVLSHPNMAVLLLDELPVTDRGGGLRHAQACLFGARDMEGLMVLGTYCARLLSALSEHRVLFQYVPEVCCINATSPPL